MGVALTEQTMAKVETETQARQGEKGKSVLYVLIAAVLLAVIAGAGALTWQIKVSPVDPASRSQDSAHQTAATPSTVPAYKEPATNPSEPVPAQPKAN
jgi:flagellar basal body-associated protein FliL